MGQETKQSDKLETSLQVSQTYLEKKAKKGEIISQTAHCIHPSHHHSIIINVNDGQTRSNMQVYRVVYLF